MKRIFTSNLSEIKTVFGSNDDNVHYYRLLKQTGFNILDNVELARPIININKVEIVWKAETNLNLKPFNELSEDAQASTSYKLRKYIEDFKKQINNLKNVPEGFANRLLEIPSKNSLLVNEESQYIVIINWGFLEDSHDRTSGIIEGITLGPAERKSILIRLLDKNREAVEGIKLKLESNTARETSGSDKNGYARFGTLRKGEQFNICDISSTQENILLGQFICDGRNEYEIVLDKKVNIDLRFKDKNGFPLSGGFYTLKSEEYRSVNFELDKFGRYSFILQVQPGNFAIERNGKTLFEHKIPGVDSIYEITDNPVGESITPTDLDRNHITLLFVNRFDRRIRDLQVHFENLQGNSFSRKTDNEGKIHLSDIEKGDLTYSFTRYNKEWEDTIHINSDSFHKIKVHSIFPWFWWSLMFILLALLLCCSMFNCFCKSISSFENPVTDTLIIRDTIILRDTLVIENIPCNTSVNSGGAGISRNRHPLGNRAAIIRIDYDMMNIPDKLEVFYEGELVATTEDIPNNEDGFVGRNNDAGCCGTLTFNYNPNIDEYCIVRVTGTIATNTAWQYVLYCP